MRSLQQSIRIISSIAFASVLIILFQNCGERLYNFEDLQATAESSFFSYPYKTKPDFYTELQLFSTSSSLGSVFDVTVIASVTRVDGAFDNIDYDLRVRSKTGALLCSPLTGVLMSGESFIEHVCTSTDPIESADVTLTLNSNGKSTVEVIKSY